MNESVKEVVETSRAALLTDEPVGQKLYRHNVLEGFGNGCLLDLRVRLAIELLKSSPMFSCVVPALWPEDVPRGATPEQLAGYALDVAVELMRDAEKRGFVEDLPKDEGLNRQLRLQSARTARYQVWQQMAGQRVAAEDAARVSPVSPGFDPGAGRRN